MKIRTRMGWILSVVAAGLATSCASVSKPAKISRKISSVTEMQGDAPEVIRAIGGQFAGKKIVTFIGYSSQGYQDPAAVERTMGRILEKLDPKKVVVNAGLTEVGIGAVYGIAHSAGFETMAVVSTESSKYPGGEAAVDAIFRVNDTSWGGIGPDGELTPTSQVNVAVSDEMIGFGGGEVGYYELLGGIKKPIPVRIFSVLNAAGGDRKGTQMCVNDLKANYRSYFSDL